MDPDLARLVPEELSYVNEVDAALARTPTRGVRILSLTVCVFFLCIILWAAFATVDEVTHAEGQVVSSQRTQAIQNLEGGILQSVLVREGQIVEKGTPLARLDNEMAGSYYRDAISKALDNQAAILRLNAELTDTPPVFPDNLAEGIKQLVDERLVDDLESMSQRIVADHTATYKARTTQRAAELEVLVSQFNQRQRDVEEQLSRKNQLERSLRLATEQRDIAYPLMQRRNYSRVEFLGLEQKVVALQGDIESIAASLPKAQAAAREAEQRIAFRKAELNSAVTEEINKRRMELNSLRETLAAGGDRVARTELRSPVRGTVKQVYINSVGGVVKPGESIMEIVPLDDTLLVEARVRPADVAFLHPGQKAVVKVSAYDFSIYGGLEGHLEQISADTIEDKRGDFYYLVKVRTPKTSISYRQEHLPIIPGMITTVDILTGKKTVLSYLLKPILKARQNALTER
ncbi:MAG: HlyD family type I secretion periplasmic adaptor subunit [Desulfovibrionaceae bacterium]